MPVNRPSSPCKRRRKILFEGLDHCGLGSIFEEIPTESPSVPYFQENLTHVLVPRIEDLVKLIISCIYPTEQTLPRNRFDNRGEINE